MKTPPESIKPPVAYIAVYGDILCGVGDTPEKAVEKLNYAHDEEYGGKAPASGIILYRASAKGSVVTKVEITWNSP